MAKLALDGKTNLLMQLSKDFIFYTNSQNKLPKELTYKISSLAEDYSDSCKPRIAALYSISKKLDGFVKLAFDTRRIDQDSERNPRTNLQFWNRSQQFLEESDSRRLNIFAKLIDPLKEIQEEYSSQPEYFTSYARKLNDIVNRALRVKEGDLEVYRPQLDYLEQLLYTRYRLSLDDMSSKDKDSLKKAILKKDEDLLKRGDYLNLTSKKSNETFTIKDGHSINENIVNAIFGNNEFRREGEKKVTRTITISITDSVED